MKVRLLDPRIHFKGRDIGVPIMGLGHAPTPYTQGKSKIVRTSPDICPYCEAKTLTPEKRRKIAEKLARELQVRAEVIMKEVSKQRKS